MDQSTTLLHRSDVYQSDLSSDGAVVAPCSIITCTKNPSAGGLGRVFINLINKFQIME